MLLVVTASIVVKYPSVKIVASNAQHRIAERFKSATRTVPKYTKSRLCATQVPELYIDCITVYCIGRASLYDFKVRA